MIVAHPSSNIRTIADLIASAKKGPGPLNYSSAGVGNFSHLAMELFARRAGIKLLHVPYRGAGPAASGLIAGDVQLGVADVQVVMQNVQAGLLVPLGVGEQERISALPDVPTNRRDTSRLYHNAVGGPPCAGPGRPARSVSAPRQ